MLERVENVRVLTHKLHEHNFQLTSEGEVNCIICGVRDDEMPQAEENVWKDPFAGYENQRDFE